MVAESIADGGVGEEQGTASGEEKGHRVDTSFVSSLSEDFSIPERDVTDAFLGESMIRALRICEWVETTDAKNPKERGEVLTKWAKKHKSGIYANYSSGPSGGPTKTPERTERTKFSPEQVEKNLSRLGT